MTLGSTSFKIDFYTDPGTYDQNTGLYEPNGSPFSTAVIEQVGSTNHVRVTTIFDGNSTVYDYEWDSTNNG